MEQQTFTEQAGVRYTVIGKGKRVHYSPNNDESLCGRGITEYLDVSDAAALFSKGNELCAPCHRAAEKRAEARRLAAASPLAAAVVDLVDTIEQADAEQAAADGTWRGEWIGSQDDDALFPVERNTEQGALFADRAMRLDDLAATVAQQHVEADTLLADTAEIRTAVDQFTADVVKSGAKVDAVVEQVVVEGVVVEHAGAAEGSTPSNAAHPDVAAARVPLTRLAAATMTDHHDVTEPNETERTVRGYLVDPRGQGRVALYWLEEGRIVRRDDKGYGASLDCLAWTMERAGWTVEKLLRSSQCVFAHRPTEDAAPAVEPAAPECLHRIAVRPDVSGDPIKACARKQPNQEAGVFNDEGCIEAYDCAVQAANRAAEWNAEDDDADPTDPAHMWDLLCPDHRDNAQQIDECDECDAAERSEAVAQSARVE